jgi:hypothetical protein
MPLLFWLTPGQADVGGTFPPGQRLGYPIGCAHAPKFETHGRSPKPTYDPARAAVLAFSEDERNLSFI